MITALAITTQLLFVIFPGLVLHRALAVRLVPLDLAGDSLGEIREVDLVAYGLLPGLAIASTIGSSLALFGFFRTEVFAAVMVAAVVWRRRDAAATLAALAEQGHGIWRSLARGELMTLVAVGIFAQNAFALTIYAQLPSDAPDVWNHQVPLARSIVLHAGFVFPQIDHMFYGTYPIFVNMLFAEGLLFVDNVIAANVMSSLIYIGFLLTLLVCARRQRAVAAVVLSILIINTAFFSVWAAVALTDLPRSCFSVLALVFTYRYLRDRRIYFLFAAGLLAGGAVAAKYTELIIPVLIGLSLMPVLMHNGKSWAAVGVFAAAFVPVACYPYLKNWILLGNPVYPFFFGHSGLSDAWMAGVTAELTRPFDPYLRTYVTNLLSPDGWRGLFTVINDWFFYNRRYAYGALVLIGIGLYHRQSLIAYPAVWAFCLAIIWYTGMLSAIRWAFPFYLLTLSTGFLAWAWLVDHFAPRWEPSAGTWHALLKGKVNEARLARMPGWLKPKTALRATLAGLALYPCIWTMAQVGRDGLAGLMPSWSDRQLAGVIFDSSRLEAYLERTRFGYQIYRLIADRNLRAVFQPFDSAATLYQVAYNGGHNGGWVLPYQALPSGPADFDDFVRRNEIKYFIYRPSLSPGDTERLGPERIRLAYALLERLLPRSQRIVVDTFGWELYAIDAKSVPPT